MLAVPDTERPAQDETKRGGSHGGHVHERERRHLPPHVHLGQRYSRHPGRPRPGRMRPEDGHGEGDAGHRRQHKRHQLGRGVRGARRGLGLLRPSRGHRGQKRRSRCEDHRKDEPSGRQFRLRRRRYGRMRLEGAGARGHRGLRGRLRKRYAHRRPVPQRRGEVPPHR